MFQVENQKGKKYWMQSVCVCVCQGGSKYDP